MPPTCCSLCIDGQPSVEPLFLQHALLLPTCPEVAASHPASTVENCETDPVLNDSPLSTFMWRQTMPSKYKLPRYRKEIAHAAKHIDYVLVLLT